MRHAAHLFIDWAQIKLVNVGAIASWGDRSAGDDIEVRMMQHHTGSSTGPRLCWVGERKPEWPTHGDISTS